MGGRDELSEGEVRAASSARLVDSAVLAVSPGAREARALLEALPDGVAVARGQELVFVNAALVELLEYAAPAELTALPVYSWLSAHVVADERSEAVDLLAACLRGQRDRATDERRMLTRQRRQLYAHLTYSRVVFEGDSALLIAVRDFTASNDARRRLGHTDRLASIGSMAAGVAHEINNPLAYITTNIAYAVERIRYIEGLLDIRSAVQVDSPQTLRGLLQPLTQALTEAHEGAGRVSQLVRDLRALTQDDSEFSPVDLESALRSAIHMSRSEYRYRARLVEQFAGSGAVLGNETRLVQLFLNLVANAAQSFESDTPDVNKILVRAKAEDDRVTVEVIDNGRGIPAELMPRVYDPFFTTRPPGQGSGLGLTICTSLVESMEGTLRLESARGKGTRAVVVLPRARGSSRPARPRPTSIAPARRARVLIIDNEPLIVRAVARLLAGEHDVESASNGVEGLELLRHEGPFDVVVCDLMMPEMNGMELYRRVEVELPDVAGRFLFLTGGAFTDQATAFLRDVDRPTLDKPLQPDVLRAAVLGVLGR